MNIPQIRRIQLPQLILSRIADGRRAFLPEGQPPATRFDGTAEKYAGTNDQGEHKGPKQDPQIPLTQKNPPSGQGYARGRKVCSY
jgi:hypothetical protein